MRKVSGQKILPLLLMLVFGVQVMASANITCHHQPADMHVAEQVMAAGMMDHSQHLDLTVAADGAAVDCCSDCDCAGSCSSAVALFTATSLFFSNPVPQASRYSELLDDRLTTSFYRPPIAR